MKGTPAMEPSLPDPHDRPPHTRSGSFGQTARAVAWSFLGIRRAADQEQDLKRINPIHVIAAGIVGALLFVLALVALVHWVTSLPH